MAVAELLVRHRAAWHGATHHPFLDGVRDGTLPPDAFYTWLVQDAYFVADLLRFQARLLARAPRSAQPVLAAGTVALVDELAWFEQQAVTRQLHLDSPPLAPTGEYAALLERLDTADVSLALIGLWAIERAYLDAWSSALPGTREYREFVEHWTVPGFAEYVAGLEAAADRLLTPDTDTDAVFLEVVAAETAFWDMAMGTR